MTWPITNETYGTYQWLMREVGRVLEYDADQATWGHQKTGVVNSAVQRGVRAFYAPPPIQGERYSHEWSFLRPKTTIATVADTYLYTLPADCALVPGPLTYAPGSGQMYSRIEKIGERQLEAKLQDENFTGPPRFFATRPMTLAPTTGTRDEMLLYPIPDDVYTLHYRYRVNPVELTTTNKYPCGGMQHYETILASCIAIAKPELYPVYLERLRASVSHDRLVAAPDWLGYNEDPSDSVGDVLPTSHEYSTPVTFNGELY